MSNLLESYGAIIYKAANGKTMEVRCASVLNILISAVFTTTAWLVEVPATQKSVRFDFLQGKEWVFLGAVCFTVYSMALFCYAQERQPGAICCTCYLFFAITAIHLFVWLNFTFSNLLYYTRLTWKQCAWRFELHQVFREMYSSDSESIDEECKEFAKLVSGGYAEDLRRIRSQNPPSPTTSRSSRRNSRRQTQESYRFEPQLVVMEPKSECQMCRQKCLNCSIDLGAHPSTDWNASNPIMNVSSLELPD